MERVDLKARLWTVPSERFKSNAAHIVPLTQVAIDILNSLPRDAERLFGHINGFSKAKRRLDKAMGDPPPFVIHDIRRTVRTRLSSLRVPYEVAEMVIGHGKKGLARVYDQHHYLPEMRDALERWETSLRAIVATDERL
jgi:integrase